MIRVLLVDDQRLVRAGLRMLCGSAADLEVVAEAGHGEDAVRFAAELRPDVVLMDLRMPGVDGATATRRILQERPDTRVVVLTTFDDDDHLYPALSAGACGFLAKDVTPDELLDGIRRAAAGGHPFSPDVLRRVVVRASRSASGSGPVPGADLGAGVSGREREILGLLAQGLSNAEIATRLRLGATTVKAHISALMDRTGSPNRVRLAVLAAQSGLLPGG
ncbi:MULTISPECIES: response regulator transcription factor [unclassified Kitasatospora]|uniref:response regulator n=1 Tax=unclassified Kitasatospora TaxID=2633591 RepID=UPI00070896D5|nr:MULTISPECIES: response regulator transcription factor [unclassified Kitasatospora]KQV15838.1 LuxR family transcriptional regulator [Kitasatospora sp. Root107]KRB65129.1 LuxR family transcriptional regulator [Kitasatospora sp. Root187]